MEKYYCEFCCTITNEQSICRVCGKGETKKIIIDVQSQVSNKDIYASD